MSYIPEPVTRIDKYLAYIAGNMDVALPDHPITRKEHYLAAWAEKSGFEDVDVTGEPPLTLENTISKPFKDLKLYGRSKQVTTTGAQLISAKTDATEINGITYSSEYGKVTLDGIASADTTISIPSAVKLEEGKTYTISSTSLVGVNNVAIYSSIITLDSTAKTAMATGTGTPGILIYIASGTTYHNDELCVMVEEGSTAHPYEPYTGGLPSPSPDYPQEVESVGQGGIIGVEVRGKNLLDPAQAYQSTTSNYRMYKDGFLLKKGVTYTLSCYPSKADGLYIIGVPDYDKLLAVSYKKSFVTYTPNEDVMVTFNYYLDGKLDPKTSKLMLEIGENHNPSYEPYHEPQSADIATPNGLPGIPVSADGNYTDAYRQQWVCDEIDLAKGERVQWIGKTVVDGKKVKFISSSGSIYWNLPYGTSPGIINGDTSISRYFAERTFFGNNNYDFAWTTSEKMKPYFATSEELNAFCVQKNSEGNPLTIYYCIETPIRTPLSPETIAAYKQLHTYKGTTIIDNDAGAYMSVRYEKMK